MDLQTRRQSSPRRSSLVRNSLALAISQAVLLYAGGVRAQVDGCTVTSAADGAPASGDSVKTFRECLAEAEAGTGDFVIDFDPAVFPSTITYDPTVPAAANSAFEFAYGESGSGNGANLTSLTIDGDVNNDGVPDVTLDAGTQGVRTLYINGNNGSAAFDLTIDGLVITGGETNASDDGAGLLVDGGGSVVLRNSTITGNTAGNDGSEGDAAVKIEADLYVTVDNVSITNNVGANLGGLYVKADGAVLISNSAISNNTGTGAQVFTKYGGITVSDSRIENNTLGLDGDASYTGSGLVAYAWAETGSAITITDSSISGNATAGALAVVLTYDGTGGVQVENSSLIGNGAGAESGPKYAGLVSTLFRLSENSASGSVGQVHVVNSTISGNTGSQVLSLGFAVTYNENANEADNTAVISVDIVNSTIVSPTENAKYPVLTLGFNSVDKPGTKYSVSTAREPLFNVANSVIVSGEDAAFNCLTVGKYDDEGYGATFFQGAAANSILGATLEYSEDACAPGAGSFLIGGSGVDDPATLGDVLNLTQGTEGLVRVGGITQVYPLAAGSVAIDNGDNSAFEAVCTGDAACAGVDQRGADRPETVGGTVDIGAYEAFADGDNIPPSEENAVPGINGSAQGDGNDDGIPDSSQENVSSGIAASGPAGPIYATLTATDTTNPNDALQFTNEVWSSTVPPGAPAGSFPLGGFTFTVTGFAPGDAVALELFIPASLGATELNKFINGTWLPLPSTLETVGDRTKFSFSIQDGGPFDADGIVNGSITDPVFPTVTATAIPVPATPWYSLPILSALLALLGWRQRRRLRR